MRNFEDTYRHKGMRKQLVDIVRQKGITDERVLELREQGAPIAPINASPSRRPASACCSRGTSSKRAHTWSRAGAPNARVR